MAITTLPEFFSHGLQPFRQDFLEIFNIGRELIQQLVDGKKMMVLG